MRQSYSIHAIDSTRHLSGGAFHYDVSYTINCRRVSVMDLTNKQVQFLVKQLLFRNITHSVHTNEAYLALSIDNNCSMES